MGVWESNKNPNENGAFTHNLLSILSSRHLPINWSAFMSSMILNDHLTDKQSNTSIQPEYIHILKNDLQEALHPATYT